MQVRFELASLANLSISETVVKIVLAVVCINGLTGAFGVAVVSHGISWQNAANCTGFLPPIDSRRHKSRNA